jgi:hypothetical protein
MDLVGRALQVQVVQNGVTPDTVKRSVGEREHLSVGLDPFDLRIVADCPSAGLGKIAAGKFESRDAGPASREDDGRHSMAAPQIEHPPSANIAEPSQRRADPAFVIEVGFVVDKESFGGQIGTASCRLGVVILALHCQPRHRVPFA